MTRRLSRLLSLVILIAVLGVCFYRAKTQSFTVDEAWVFNSFVNKDLMQMAKSYDACNHVLHTLLMKVARAWLGITELALRTPSLLAALLYCIAVWRLGSLLFTGWMQVVFTVLLTANPMVLDFLVAARGYGLALALFLWAFHYAILYCIQGQNLKWLRRAGVLAGLSIAANLTMAIPVVALGGVICLLSAREGWKAAWRGVDGFAGPALVTAFLICVIPLLNAKSGDFYYGAPTFGYSMNTLLNSITKVNGRWPSDFLWACGQCAAPWIAGAFILLFGWSFITRSRHYLTDRTMPWRQSPYLLAAGTLLVSLLLIVVAHALVGMKYPEGRTGLYLIPLFFLAVCLGLRIAEEGRFRHLAFAGKMAAALIAVISVMHTDGRFFKEWRFDSRTNRLMRKLHEDVALGGRKWDFPVSLGTHTYFTQTARYYKLRQRMDFLKEPETVEPGKTFDYYLLLPSEDQNLIRDQKLEIVENDTFSGAVVARRPR